MMMLPLQYIGLRFLVHTAYAWFKC